MFKLLNFHSLIVPTIKSGSVVVDTSTVSSNTAQKAARILAEKGVGFLDAPVSGCVESAKNGTLTMMVGGNETALQEIYPILQVMANRIVYMGGTGTGQATKAVNQILCAGINEAVAEALAFAGAQNLPMEKVIEVISGGAAGNWFLEKRELTMTNRSFLPGFELHLHHKDLKICQEMAGQIGVPIPLSDSAVVHYAELMQQGFGDEDISALYRLKSR